MAVVRMRHAEGDDVGRPLGVLPVKPFAGVKNMGLKLVEMNGETRVFQESRRGFYGGHPSVSLPPPFGGQRRTEEETNPRPLAGGFCFGMRSILSTAPAESGVYVVYSEHELIYVGESDDIRASLLRHLEGGDPPIVLRAPTRFAFAYELLPPESRVARQNQLILELNPACNQPSI